MKPSEKFPKKGAFLLHAKRSSRLIRLSSKKQIQPNPSTVKSSAATSRPSKEKRSNLVSSGDVVVTPLNSKNRSNVVNDDDRNTATAMTTTPPVEASVSPEIQMASISTTTPATGNHHIHTAISGITDNRKCRARGLLAVTNTLTESNDDVNNNVTLPFPSQASMHWLDSNSPTLPFTANSSPTTCTSNSSPNVMRTPKSADSDSSIAESLRITTVDFSFEFETITTNADVSTSSVDLTRFRIPHLLQNSCGSENEDFDTFDSCRCSSDDEESNIVFEDIVPQIKPEGQQEKFVSASCAESISTDGGGPLASSKDSDWDFDLLQL